MLELLASANGWLLMLLTLKTQISKKATLLQYNCNNYSLSEERIDIEGAKNGNKKKNIHAKVQCHFIRFNIFKCCFINLLQFCFCQLLIKPKFKTNHLTEKQWHLTSWPNVLALHLFKFEAVKPPCSNGKESTVNRALGGSTYPG